MRLMKVRGSHKDLQQIMASRFIKTTFNKSNSRQNQVVDNSRKMENL